MSEFWNGLSRRAFIGSGRLTCKHATEWQADIWLAQLFNGRIVVQVCNIEEKPADTGRWPEQCEPFTLMGTLNDGRNLTVKNIHFTRRLFSFEQGGRCTFEGFVCRPGFAEVANPDSLGTSFQRLNCEVTNLFLGRSVRPIEADVGKAQIRLDYDSDHNVNRRQIEALRTAGILGSIIIELLGQASQDHLDGLIRSLCFLLTLAQRSPVNCVAQHWQDAKGTSARSRYQEPVFYYPTAFIPLIPAESLATFVQETFENSKRQAETWDLGHAIDHYVQAMSLRSVWSQAVGFFTALETLKNAFLQQPGKATLGYLLPKREFKQKGIVKQVVECLDKRHEIFKDLPDEDRRAERESLKGKVGSLNRRAYKLVLRDMFRELEVPVEDSELARLLKLRNQIIHTGSPNYRESPWNNPSEASAWAAGFAGLVERTILAILGYRGDFARYDQVARPYR